MKAAAENQGFETVKKKEDVSDEEIKKREEKEEEGKEEREEGKEEGREAGRIKEEYSWTVYFDETLVEMEEEEKMKAKIKKEGVIITLPLKKKIHKNGKISRDWCSEIKVE